MRKQFVTEAPSHRNAYALFEGRWAMDLSEIDASLPKVGMPGFRADPRPLQAAQHLGRDGRFDGYDVLELGPLEAGHTYQLERLGARRVTAVESNSDAFLKSLIVKNVAGLDRSTFLLGDAIAFLAEESTRYDLIFCSGLLYHMFDPVELLRLAAARTDRIFIWTHYVDAANRPKHLKPRDTGVHGLDLRLYEFAYIQRETGKFWGGNRAKTHWLELPSILSLLRLFGLTEIAIIEDRPDAPNGSAVTLAAQRPGAATPGA